MRFAPIRLHYLLAYAIVGAYMPYLPVFLGHDLGMPDWQIGWIAGSYGFAVIVSPPLVTYLADRRFSGRILIGLVYGLTACAFTALALAERFVPVLLISIAFSVAFTPLFALLDGLTFTVMSREQAEGRPPPPFNQIRVWGSLGFMIPAFVLFFALQAGAASGRAAIVVAATTAALALLCLPVLPRIAPVPRDPSLPGAAAWHVLRAAPTRNLIVPLSLLFVGIAVFYGFYARLVLAVGIAPSWVGLVMNIGVLSELPFMFAAGPILRRFSLRSVLLFGAACLAVRLALLAAVPDPRVTVASQLLHGPVVIAIYLIPPMYLNLKAPPSVRNSVQGLYTMLCFGLARLFGSVIAGYVASLALAWAFAMGSMCATIALIWLWLGFHDPEADAALRQRAEPEPSPAGSSDMP